MLPLGISSTPSISAVFVCPAGGRLDVIGGRTKTNMLLQLVEKNTKLHQMDFCEPVVMTLLSSVPHKSTFPYDHRGRIAPTNSKVYPKERATRSLCTSSLSPFLSHHQHSIVFKP